MDYRHSNFQYMGNVDPNMSSTSGNRNNPTTYTPHPHPEYGYIYDGSKPYGTAGASSTLSNYHAAHGSNFDPSQYDANRYRGHPNNASSSSSPSWGAYSPSPSDTSLTFEDSASLHLTELPPSHASGSSAQYMYPPTYYSTSSRSGSQQPPVTDHPPRGTGLVRGPSSAWSISNNRSIHLHTYNDARYHRACNEIIKQMARVRIPVHAAGSDMVLCLEGGAVPVPSSTQFRQLVAAYNPECTSIFSELDRYVNIQDDDIRAWLKEGIACTVGTDAILKAASKRRASRRSESDTLLFVCLWCGLLTTTKGNLSNHIRAHLGFHISFCENCNFSSVTSTIPSRHRARCNPTGGAQGEYTDSPPSSR